MATIETWLAAVASIAFCVVSLVHLFVRREPSSILPVYASSGFVRRGNANMVISRWNARSRTLEPLNNSSNTTSAVEMITQPVVMAAKKAANLIIPSSTADDADETTLKASFAAPLSPRTRARFRSADGLLYLCELKRSRLRPDGDFVCGAALRRYAILNNHLNSVKREARRCEGIEAA